MASKITFWLTTTIVLSLGFGQLLRLTLGPLTFYFHDLVIFVILLLNFNQLRRLQVNDLGLKIFAAGLVISSLTAIFLYSPNLLVIPFLYMFRLLCYLVLFLMLKEQKITIPTHILELSAVTTIVIGLAQYFFMPDMRWAQYLGWDDHLNRLVMPHYDPTFTAVMITLAILSLPINRNGSSLLRIILSVAAVLLTYARSVWISLFLTIFYFMRNRLLLFVIAFAFTIAIFILPKRFGEGTNLLRTYSVSSRLSADWQYLTKYNWSLITGRGLNTLILDNPRTIYPSHSTGPNDSYLYLLVTVGVTGLLGWGIFMFGLYHSSTHQPMLIFFLVASVFNNVMFYPFALLWVLLIESTAPTST